MRKVSASKRKSDLQKAANTSEENVSVVDSDNESDNEALISKRDDKANSSKSHSDDGEANEKADDATGSEKEDEEQSEASEQNGSNANGKKRGRKPGKQVAKKNGTADAEGDSEGSENEEKPAANKKQAKTKKAGKQKKRKGAKSPKKKPVEDDEEDDEEEEEYEVQAVVGHKVEKGVTFYQIRWKGYSADDDTWEKEDDLSCQDLIDKYKKKEEANNKKSPKSKGPPKKRAKLEKEEEEEEEDGSDTEKEWEVERIIDLVDDKRKGRLFRIRWKGFRANQDTWEPESNLNCKDLIEKFIAKYDKIQQLGPKHLREEPKRTHRFSNEMSASHSRGRKSKRSVGHLRTTYYEADD